MAIGMAVFLLIPETLLGIFNPDPLMRTVGIPALRIMCLPFIPAGMSIMCSGVFQALDRSIFSMIVSISRQLLVLIPAAYLLSLSGNIDAVWLSYPIAEVVSLLITVVLMISLYRKKIRPLAQQPLEN